MLSNPKYVTTIRSFLVFAALLAVLTGITARQAAASPPLQSGIDTLALDEFILAEMQKHGLPGVALAIHQGDEIVYARGYGAAGKGRLMTADTPMYIGSLSKSFTALAILQLAEQGKLDLEAPVRTYLPWFRIADEESSQKITVRHLLHHASGLSDRGFSFVIPEQYTLEDAVRSLEKAHLTAPVGMKMQYFNLNYTALALIVQTVSGQEFGDYLEEHIFTSLEMQHTYTTAGEGQQNGLAQGYSRFFGFPIAQAQPHPAYGLGEGYIISTASDLAHYSMAMNNQGRYKEISVPSPDWMEVLHSPRPQQGPAYAMGWYVDSAHGVKRIQHGGANETFKTFLQLYPGQDLGIILLINQGYMFDHFISAPQVMDGVEQIVLQAGTPDPAAGVAVPWIGYGLLAFTLVVGVFNGWQISRMPKWPERARQMSPARRGWDIAVNFIVPSVILGVVIWQTSQFMDYRFNIVQQALMMRRVLPDLALLMVVGILPDYVMGITKLAWVARGLTRYE